VITSSNSITVEPGAHQTGSFEPCASVDSGFWQITCRTHVEAEYLGGANCAKVGLGANLLKQDNDQPT